jgi:glycosyltransferase involved in cell wall biosynthesis
MTSSSQRTEPLRVLHLITDLDVGGAERTLLHLVTAIDPRRIEQQVICMLPIGDIGRQMQERGIRVTSLGMRPGRPDLRSFVKLLGLLRRARPRILHTWLYHADLLGLLAGSLTRVPAILWNVRNSGMDFRRYRRLSGLVMRLCAWLSPVPRAVVVNSHAGRVDHARLGYRPRAWRLIPNGVDTGRFRPDAARRAALRGELGLTDSTPLVGMVARYDPMKGHAVFARAAGEIARNDERVRFLLAGRGADAANGDLLALLHRHGLVQNTHLLGVRHDVETVHAALDVLVSASEFGEGFSNVIAEAMAAGVPCVVTDVGDSAWIVGETGAIVPSGDPAALARAGLDLLSRPAAERGRLGAAARRRIQENFGLDTLLAAYESLYHDMAV